MGHTSHEESIVKTWIWVAAMLSIILFKGFFSFFVVSDRGQPDWNFEPVPDVPASSAYATYPNLPNPQHVRGQNGE